MKTKNDLVHVHGIYDFYHEIYGESFITYARNRQDFSGKTEAVSQLINDYIDEKAKYGFWDLNLIDQDEILHPAITKEDYDLLMKIFKKIIFHDEFEKSYKGEMSCSN